MKKILYIIIGILILMGVTFFVFNIYKKNTTIDYPTTGSQTPDMQSIDNMTKQGKIDIPTSEGSVLINDPYKGASTVVAGNAEVKKTPEYDIVYLGDLKSFVITIFGKNLDDSRSQAEQAFLDLFGLSKSDACKLKVTLSVDKDTNANLAGEDFRLSFCPSGKPFPAQ